jgi:acyl-CoA synthetase (AMP-forming)/AMP-acid ligase II
MSAHDTVLSRILAHASRDPNAAAWTDCDAQGNRQTWSRGELTAHGAAVAEVLADAGVGHGDLVALVVPHGEALAAAWLGAVLRGAVPTILAEPSVRMPAEVYADMLGHLVRHLQPRAVLTSGERAAQLVRAAAADIPCLDVAEMARAAPVKAHVAGASDVVALQHSSGTTGRHKGVVLTHAQVIAQIDAYAAALHLDPATDRVASWLPLYHDMGFIACFVLPLMTGIETVQMSPFQWVARPWLLPQMVAATRATLSWLPNFAYHLIASRCTDAHLAGLDLSCWRQVINCSEPCTASAFDHFRARLEGHGLAPSALGVSYAMAETVFAVTEAGVRRAVVERRVDGKVLAEQQRLVDAEGPGAVRLIGCGQPVAGCEVDVRDPNRQPVAADTIGEIWVRAPFLMRGYHLRPELDEQVLRDGWYGTGDLGCVAADGEVFVTGRAKDLLIIGGINVFPQDVEEIVAAVPGVVAGRVVAVGAWNAELETQRLVVLVEAEDGRPDARARLNLAIRTAVGTRAEVQVGDVRVWPRGTLRKSTSGKLSRAANLRHYLEGPGEDDHWAAASAPGEGAATA